MRVSFRSRLLVSCAFAPFCAVAVLFAPSPLLAAPSPSPSPVAAPTDDAKPAKDGGTIDGHVSSIDYKSGVMTVDVGDGSSKKSYDVIVVPGTNILGQKSFYTIADLKKGGHVQVLMSRHGTTNTAQIIKLL